MTRASSSPNGANQWDAYRSLNITNRHSDGVTCVGNTVFGNRCWRDISYERSGWIRSILNELETKLPADAIPALEYLARWGLCEEYHQGQVFAKVAEWEVAVEEATLFYESRNSVQAQNRELKWMLEKQKSGRKGLERSIQEMISRINQDSQSISSMWKEVSILRSHLAQAQTEVRDSKEAAQRWSNTYYEHAAEMDGRIAIMQAGWSDERQNMTTRLPGRGQRILSMNSQLKELKATESCAVKKASELVVQLNNKLDTKMAMQSEILEIRSERDLVLSQKDELKSQLDTAAEQIDKIGLRLEEAEAARDRLSEEEDKCTGLVQEVGILNAQISSERRNAAELRQYLQKATENHSSTNTELKYLRQELFSPEEKLENLRVKYTKDRDDFEDERRELSTHQAASLARID